MITQIQGNPNVILKETAMTHNQVDKSYEANVITPAVNLAYSNGATTVRVVDMNGVDIGQFPRANPNA